MTRYKLPCLSLTLLAGLTALLGLPAAAAAGTPTTVVVRAVSHDAKILGDNVGGARITIRDVATGALLAEGIQQGNTGDTDRIMRQPHERAEPIYDTEGAAAFEATLDLERPTVVEITAEGPLDTPGSARRASKTLLVLPGEDVTGDGVILEIHGFRVRLEAPGASSAWPAGDEVEVHAEVRMTCGCPIEPGGLWDSRRLDLEARLVRDGRVISRGPLRFTGETSHFRGVLGLPEIPGPAELLVLVRDAERANFGWASTELEVVAAVDDGR